MPIIHKIIDGDENLVFYCLKEKEILLLSLGGDGCPDSSMSFKRYVLFLNIIFPAKNFLSQDTHILF
jgi:hypothetical protein